MRIFLFLMSALLILLGSVILLLSLIQGQIRRDMTLGWPHYESPASKDSSRLRGAGAVLLTLGFGLLIALFLRAFL